MLRSKSKNPPRYSSESGNPLARIWSLVLSFTFLVRLAYFLVYSSHQSTLNGLLKDMGDKAHNEKIISFLGRK